MQKGVGNFAWRNFLPFNSFVMQQVRSSNHRLIKISMLYMHIKLEVKKKYDTTAMTTVINEACFGWLHENCCLVKGIFLVWVMSIFLLLIRVLPPSTAFSLNGRFGGRGRAVHTWLGQYAAWKEGEHFW